MCPHSAINNVRVVVVDIGYVYVRTVLHHGCEVVRHHSGRLPVLANLAHFVRCSGRQLLAGGVTLLLRTLFALRLRQQKSVFF